MSTIYHKIKALAKAQGITIKAIEEELGVAENSIRRWNTVMPAADKLSKVAKILGTTVEDLLEAREEAADGS